jgi:hypothetical protein
MNWPEFWILYIAALVGAFAVLPYGMRLLPKDKPLKFSKPVLLLISVLQSALIFAVTIALGLMAAHAVGLGAPYIEAILSGATLPPPYGLIVALVFGIIVGAALLVADLGFVPYWPLALRETALKTTALENFLASFYGGINEELIMRLFGLSALVWLASFVWRPNDAIFWIANLLMTILFGLGHLPALKNVLNSLPRMMVVRSLLLNAPVGLVCGWLFWTYGIETAIIAHFAADIVYHVLGTRVLRYTLRGSNGNK